MALRTVGVRLQAEVAGYVNNLRTARRATSDFVGDLDRAAKAGRLDAVADSAGTMGLGLVAGFGLAVNAAAKFDKQMSEVAAVSNATGGDLEKLRQSALAAGKDTAFSATEAAKAQAELAKAGMSTADILNGGLRGAMNLAAAGGLDLAEAADISAKTLNIFGLSSGQAGHVADLLASAANKSATDVHEMGEAMKMAGLAANAAGLSVDETTGTLAAFADNALVGSDAGTSLKQMLLMIQAPTDKAAGLMQELGINAYDAGGNFVGTAELAGQLKTQLGGLTQEERNHALATIFGADAMRAANILYTEGEAGIRKYETAVNDNGAAAEVAAKKMDNLAGDVEKLKGSLETMAIEAGSGANSGLRTVVQTVDNLVGSVSGIPGPVQTAGVVIAGAGGAMLLAGAGAAKLKDATANARQELANIGPAGARAADRIEKTGKVAARAGMALAAMQVAAAALGSSAAVSGPELDALSSQLTTFAKTGEQGSTMTRIFGTDLKLLDQALYDVADEGKWKGFVRGVGGLLEGLTGAGALYEKSLQHSRERLSDLDQAMTQMVQSGQGQQAAELFRMVAQRAREQGVDVGELNKVLPGYAAAVTNAGQQSVVGADGVRQTGLAAVDAKQQVDDLKEAFDNLFDPMMSADKARLAYKNSLADLSKTVREAKEDNVKYATSLGDNTQKGRDNQLMVLDNVEAIKDLREANINNGMSIADADKAYQEQLTTLGDQLVSLGFNKTAVWDLIGGYRNVPKDASTEVKQPGMTAAKKSVNSYNTDLSKLPDYNHIPFKTPGLPQADKGVKDYDKKLDNLKTKITTSVTLEDKNKAYAKLEKLLVAQQALKKGISVSAAQSAFNKQEAKAFDGGGWTGPGPTYQEAGIVHADEWVIQKESQRKIQRAHPGVLDHMNRYGEIPGYAGGGLVAPFPVTTAGAWIPSYADAMSRVTPAAPSGGATAPFMVRVLKQAFPGLNILSTFRPGSRTLSGNRSYHSLNRAVDTEPDKAAARYMYQNYKPRLKEAITPWQQYNVHNGRDRHWSGAVWRQHAFGYGNAHNHHAMGDGGVIDEHVVGVGASGRTYEFGELGRPETVTPGLTAGPRYLTGAASGQIAGMDVRTLIAGLATVLRDAGTRQVTVGPVQVAERTDVDLLVNRLQFALAGL